MKIALRVVLGLGFGALLFWLAASQIDVSQAEAAVAKARVGPMLIALVLYWLALATRTVRWRLLLSPTRVLTFAQTARSLIIGYTVNNLLPARVGELFRVDFVRRHYGIARSAVLGSVIMERFADVLAASAVLAIGLSGSDLKAEHSALVSAALTVLVFVGVLTLGIVVVVLWSDHLLRDRFPWLSERLKILTQAITALNRRVILQTIATTVVIWALEAYVLKLIMAGFGIKVDIAPLNLIFGAAAFSTLLPSAPGYVGSLQAAFVLSFSALGLEPTLGLLSATAMQILLFGSVTMAGLTLLLAGELHGAVSLVMRTTKKVER